MKVPVYVSELCVSQVAYWFTGALLPGSNGRLQHCAQSGHEEYGGDELAFGHVVVCDAERLGEDQWDGDDSAEGKDIVLWIVNEKMERGDVEGLALITRPQASVTEQVLLVATVLCDTVKFSYSCVHRCGRILKN